jgi:cytochrome c oxidase subunit 2
MIKSEDLRLGQPRVLETDNNLILPVNKWIRLLITGVNVIHSFGLHSLGLRFDGIPVFNIHKRSLNPILL